MLLSHSMDVRILSSGIAGECVGYVARIFQESIIPAAHVPLSFKRLSCQIPAEHHASLRKNLHDSIPAEHHCSPFLCRIFSPCEGNDTSLAVRLQDVHGHCCVQLLGICAVLSQLGLWGGGGFWTGQYEQVHRSSSERRHC